MNALAAAGLALAAWASRLPAALTAWAARGGAVVPYPWDLTAAAAAGHAATLAAAMTTALALWTGGRAALRALGAAPASRLEAGAAAYALGAVLWGQLFLALGLAGLLSVPLLRALLIAGAAAGCLELARRPPDLAALRRELLEAGPVWTAGFALCLAVLLPYALSPETFYDSLEYHLGLPRLYLLRGAIGPVPDNAFAGVPSVPAMVYGWSLALDSTGTAAHVLNLLWLAATGAALAGLGRRLGAPAAGGLAAALFAAAPCVSSAAQMTGVELAWTLFSTTALSLILGAAPRAQAGPWAAAGLLIGGAMASKNLAWALPAAGLAAAWAAAGRPSKRRVAWTAAAAAAVLAPWLVKNAFHYGNPIYPFLHERIQPGAQAMPGWRYLGSGATIEWSAGLAAGAWAWLKAPLASLRYSGRLSDSAGLVLLGLLPAGLAAARRERAWRPLLAFAAAAWLPLSLVTVLPRYLIPVYAPLALAAAFAVERPGAAAFLRPLTAALLAGSSAVVWRWGLPLSRLRVFTGEVSAAEFLSRSDEAYYPAPLYPAGRWLGEHAPQDAKVLIFGDARGFHVPRDHVLSTPMQTTVLERWANAAPDGAALRARFREEGIGWILVNHAEIVRRRLELSFTVAGKRSLDEFWARCTRKTFSLGPETMVLSNGRRSLDRWLAVYEVLSEEEAARPHAADDLFAGYDVTEEDSASVKR